MCMQGQQSRIVETLLLVERALSGNDIIAEYEGNREFEIFFSCGGEFENQKVVHVAALSPVK